MNKGVGGVVQPFVCAFVGMRGAWGGEQDNADFRVFSKSSNVHDLNLPTSDSTFVSWGAPSLCSAF